MFDDITSSEIVGIKWIESFEEYEYKCVCIHMLYVYFFFSPAQGGYPSVLINSIPSGDHSVPT